jgi:hypothetical protein
MAKNKKRSKTSSSSGKDLLNDYSPVPARNNAIIALDKPLASLPGVVPHANTPDLRTLTGGVTPNKYILTVEGVSEVNVSPEQQGVPVAAGSDAGTLKDEVLVGGSSPVVSPLPGPPTEPAKGQWRDLFSSNRSTVSCPKLVHFTDISKDKRCSLSDDDLDNQCDFYKLCIVGYVAGKFPGFKALQGLVSSTWKCNASLTIHESGWLIYKFDNEEDKLSVLSGGPYLVYGRPLVLKSMPEYFDFASSEMTTVPVWVKFPNLPLRCWSATCLSKIASVIGKPLQSDMLTSTRSRLSYARVLIELDLMVDLPPSINITLPNGVDLVQTVVYETLPKFCKHCRVLGHTTSACSKVPANVEKRKMDHAGNATRGKEASVMETPLEPPRKGKMVEEHTLDPMLAEVSVDGWGTVKSRKNNNKKQRPQARGPVVGSNRVENQLASHKGKEIAVSVDGRNTRPCNGSSMSMHTKSSVQATTNGPSGSGGEPPTAIPTPC